MPSQELNIPPEMMDMLARMMGVEISPGIAVEQVATGIKITLIGGMREDDLPDGFLRCIAQTIVEKDRMPDGNDFDFWDKRAVGEVVSVAKKLVAAYPDARFIALGNSPSYIVYAIDCLTRGTGIETGYVPFSKSYVSRLTDYKGQSIYQTDPQSEEYRAALRNSGVYRTFLQNLDMAPQKIIDRFQQSGQRTVVVDNFQKGNSGASFIHFMYVWAHANGLDTKRFGAALQIVALADRPLNPLITFPQANIVVKADVLQVPRFLRATINGNLSKDVDRFVPYYAPKDWDRPPQDVESKNRVAVDRVRRKIEAATGLGHATLPTPAAKAAPQASAKPK